MRSQGVLGNPGDSPALLMGRMTIFRSSRENPTILPCDPVTAEALLACDSGMGHCAGHSRCASSSSAAGFKKEIILGDTGEHNTPSERWSRKSGQYNKDSLQGWENGLEVRNIVFFQRF